MTQTERNVHEVIPNDQATKTWLVESSNGTDNYTVATNGTDWSCTCAGYMYRGDCRHIRGTRGN